VIPAGLHPEAAKELEAAAFHYEKVRPKLGEEFLASFEQALHLIRERPGAWRRLRPSLYRVLLRRFPYGVVYQKAPGKLQILAVYHCAREPDYWLGRGVEPPSDS
jgi:plasmid stabilization system protein ParE